MVYIRKGIPLMLCFSEELETCQGWHFVRGEDPADSPGARLPDLMFDGKEVELYVQGRA